MNKNCRYDFVRNDLVPLQVFLLTYNRSHYLKVMIESILRQSLISFRLIIIDNCSTDETESVIKSFSDPRIEYIKQKENIGGINNIASAFSMANSKYFVVLHDDDVLHEDFLISEFSLMESDSSLNLVSCRANLIDDDGNIIRIYKKNNKNDITVFDSPCQYYDCFLGLDDCIIFPTAMYRTDFIKRNNIRPKIAAGPACDIVIEIDIERNGGKLAIINKSLFDYRIHSGQDSAINRVSLQRLLFSFLYSDEYYSTVILNKNKLLSKRFSKTIVHEISLFLNGTIDKRNLFSAFDEYCKIWNISFIRQKLIWLILLLFVFFKYPLLPFFWIKMAKKNNMPILRRRQKK